MAEAKAEPFGIMKKKDWRAIFGSTVNIVISTTVIGKIARAHLARRLLFLYEQKQNQFVDQAATSIS